MATCADQLTNLDPPCDALKKKGGLKKKVWVIGFDNATLTVDGDGYVDTLTIATTSPATLLNYFIGKRLKNNAVLTGEIGENANTINQDLNLVLYYYTPANRVAIENLFTSEEVIIFVETEAGQIEVYGYDTGLVASALTGGSGTALNDATALTITMSGAQDTLPKVAKFGADLAADIAYLNNLTT
jgi:hypothetical protein